jgi:hypothetical protein
LGTIQSISLLAYALDGSLNSFSAYYRIFTEPDIIIAVAQTHLFNREVRLT